MEYTRWDTATVAPSLQMDLYCSGLCESFAHLTPSLPTRGAAFSASLDLWSSPAHELSLVCSEPHTVERTQDDLRRADDDHLYLNYIAQGEMNFRQGNITRRLREGDLVVIDNNRPFFAQTNARRHHQHLALKLPRSEYLMDLMRMPDTLDAHPLSPLLRAQFALIFQSPMPLRDDLATLVSNSLETTMRHLALNPNQRTVDVCHLRTRDTVAKLIEHNAHDADFSISAVSQELGIPKRTLQHHLAATGHSFSAMLRRARLRNARADIETICRRPGSEVSVEEIGLRHGFRDASTFYRAFKRQYGYSPGAVSRPAFRRTPADF